MYTGDYEHEYPNRAKKYDEQQVDEAARAILKNQATLYRAKNNFGVINEEDQDNSNGSSCVPSIHDSASEADKHDQPPNLDDIAQLQ